MTHGPLNPRMGNRDGSISTISAFKSTKRLDRRVTTPRTRCDAIIHGNPQELGERVLSRQKWPLKVLGNLAKTGVRRAYLQRRLRATDSATRRKRQRYTDEHGRGTRCPNAQSPLSRPASELHCTTRGSAPTGWHQELRDEGHNGAPRRGTWVLHTHACRWIEATRDGMPVRSECMNASWHQMRIEDVCKPSEKWT